jgi:hypothetical protein
MSTTQPAPAPASAHRATGFWRRWPIAFGLRLADLLVAGRVLIQLT